MPAGAGDCCNTEVMRRARRQLASTVACLAIASCSLAAPGDKHADLRMMVPNAAGGGYDTTARLATQVMEDTDMTERVEVFNLDGASGAVGLARMELERGNPELLMMMGLGVVGAVVTTEPTATFADVTPIARLINEPELIVVPDDSPYRSIDDLVRDWKRRPRQVKVGGGSAPGGPDHLATHLLAETVGVDVNDVAYSRYDGGGPLLAALLTGEVDVAVSGVAEYSDQIGAGPVRVLGVTSKHRLPGLAAPTLRQQGIDFDFANWRGIVAPPDLSEGQTASLRRLVRRLHESPAWQRTARSHGWTDAYLGGRDFAAFLDTETRRVERVLAELGVD